MSSSISYGKKRVIVIRTSLDIRLPKEIAALKREGYGVTLLCWDRECNDSSPLQKDGEDDIREIRVRLRAPFGIGILFFLPIWWCFTLFHLMLTEWDIVHALNFDAIVPAAIAGKLKRKTVIYEILETYEDRVSLPRIVRYLFIQVDKLFMRQVAAVILADEAQSKEFSGVPNSRVVAVYDTPPDFFDKIKGTHPENEQFIIFQASVLYRMRHLNLDKLVSAVKDLDNVKLIIAGYGDLITEIEEWTHKIPHKIEFIGEIKYSETLKRSKAADLLFELRSSLVPQHKYICGSKLLQSMMLGKPFLANRGTSTAAKVYEENCGLVVDANNIEEIREAIIKLRDNPELSEELGANARRAYEERYSWEIMERRLLTLYQNLTDEIGQRKKREQNNGELSRQ
jgi:glycosyltransferase involved in cell wall biosynthesis